MTLFAKKPNNENKMITVGSRVKATPGQWHPNLQNFPSNTLLTGTVLRAVGKGIWDVAFDDRFHDPSVSFSSKSLILVPPNINDSAMPYKQRQKTVKMNLFNDYTKKFFKTTPVTSSPFFNITNMVNNFNTPKMNSSENNPLATLASLAERCTPTTIDLTNNKIPTKCSPSKNDFITDSNIYETFEDGFMMDEPSDEDTPKKLVDMDHEDNVLAAETYLKGLVGQVIKVPISKTNEHVNWLIINDSNVRSVPHEITDIKEVANMDPSDLFWELFPSCSEEDLKTLNRIARQSYELRNRVARRNKRRLRKWTDVRMDEFKTFVSLMVASVGTADCGNNLWKTDVNTTLAHQLFNKSPDYGRFMSNNRFNEIKSFAPFVFFKHLVDSDTKKDPWWPIGNLEEKFNENRRKFFGKMCSEYVVDESMSAFRPRTRKTGDLPHLTFCERKHENLGTEIKILADCYSGLSLTLEVMKGCSIMREKKFVKDCGVNGSILVRLTENAMKSPDITYLNLLHDIQDETMMTPPNRTSELLPM